MLDSVRKHTLIYMVGTGKLAGPCKTLAKVR